MINNAPHEPDPRLQVLIDILDRKGQAWTTAPEIQRAMLDKGEHINTRVIAELASASDGQILGTGSGYMHWRHASDNDILLSWQYNMRAAIGREKRAREIISHARRMGRLGNEQTLVKLQQDMEAEIAAPKQHRTTHHEPPAKPVTLVQQNLL
jgi:hypothetical protein